MNSHVGSDQQPAVSLQDVSKSFGGVEAVVDVNLRVLQGENHVLIGPNGAGKSTLFNLITGEIFRDKGEIVVFGRNLSHEPVQERIGMGVGRTYQTSNLFAHLTVEENLFLAVWKRGNSPTGLLSTLFRPWRQYRNQREQALEVARQVGLEDKMDVGVRDLSHGEHRQLELAITLAHQPRILLLDEPMAGLSANERFFMTKLIMGLGSVITVLLIEHDIDIAFRIADTVSVLHQGQIIAKGTPGDIRANHHVQQIYTLGTEAARNNHV
jgi:branched-chain amino acid transport system ATP-binding protein